MSNDRSIARLIQEEEEESLYIYILYIYRINVELLFIIVHYTIEICEP